MCIRDRYTTDDIVNESDILYYKKNGSNNTVNLKEAVNTSIMTCYAQHKCNVKEY